MISDKKPVARHNLGFLLGLAGVVCFGGSLPMTRLAVQGLDPWFISFLRPLIVGVLALATLIILRRPIPSRRDLWLLLLASACNTYGWPTLANFAMVTLPATHGGVVAGLLPLITAVAAAIMLRDRPPLLFWLLAVAGAVLVTGFAYYRGDGRFLPGDGLLLIGLVICAVGYVIGGSLSQRIPGWEVVFWMLILVLPVSLVGTIVTWQPDLTAAPASAWWGFAYTVVFSQILGLFAWNAGLAMGGVARVSQVQLLQTFVTLGFAVVVNREPVDALAIVVAVLIVGIIIATRRVRGA